MRRVEAENKELELRNAGLKHQRNLMNISLSMVHMDLEEVRTKVHHDLIVIKDAKEGLEEKNKRYEQLAVKYEELRKEGMLRKKKEGGGKVDEDRIYANLVGVLQEATVELEEKEVKEIGGGMEGVDEIMKTIEDSLLSLAADKAGGEDRCEAGNKENGEWLRACWSQTKKEYGGTRKKNSADEHKCF